MLLAAFLLGGMGCFLTEYLRFGKDWAAHGNNPYFNGHVVVTDRTGMRLGDKATVHWVGDGEKMIHVPMYEHYADKITGYNGVLGLYSYAQQAEIQLTLSHRVQTAAVAALGDRNGTIGVYNYQTGEILCAVSSPCFDPEEPELAEGMYVNRFVQSVYVPGSIFKIVTTAAAMDALPGIEKSLFECTGEVRYGQEAVRCERVHGKQNLYEAMANSCNCAYAQIIKELGAKKLREFIDASGVLEPVAFDGWVSTKGNCTLKNVADVSVAWSGIGQYEDLINPAAFLSFMGAVAAGGRRIEPFLVSRVVKGNKTVYRSCKAPGKQIMGEQVAEELKRMMRNNVVSRYGQEHFGGLKVCAKTGTGQVGGGKRPNAMLAGFVDDADLPLAFIVAVEDGGYGGEICIPIIGKVLTACKKE